MSEKMVRFQSRPFHAGGESFVDALKTEHQEKPFSLDPRQAAKRVGKIAAIHGIAVVQFRGTVEVQGRELDTFWLAAAERFSGPDNPDNLRVVDIAMPLKNDGFRMSCFHYIIGVAGDTSSGELEEAAAGTSFDDRIIGEFPDDISYLGTAVWSDQNRVFL